MSHFFHIDILEPYDEIFGVCKVDVKVLVVDYYYGHYFTRGLFTLLHTWFVYITSHVVCLLFQ